MNIRSNMLAASLAFSAILLSSAAVHAKPPGEEHHEKVIEALELDEARAEQVRQIMQTFSDKHRVLHQQVRKEMQALHAEKIEKLQEVLTDEEMARLKELRAEKRKEHGKGFGKDHHGMHQEHQHHN